jgi:hypothetical protein
LHVFEIDQDAVQTFGVALDLLFECGLRIRPRNDVDVRSFPLAESAKVFHGWACFETREAEPDVTVHKLAPLLEI